MHIWTVLKVQCTRLQTCGQETSLKDVKAQLATLENVDVAQMVLVHAGEALQDSAIPFLELANFNRSGEIMLDLQVRTASFHAIHCLGFNAVFLECAEMVQVKMREPVHIFLTSPLSRKKPVCEILELSARITDVLDLLEDHGLTASIERTCAVVPKRDDGSTIPVPLVTSYTISDIYSHLQTALVRLLCHRSSAVI